MLSQKGIVRYGGYLALGLNGDILKGDVFENQISL